MPFTKFWNLAPNQQDDTILNVYIYGQIKSAASFFGSQDDVVSSKFVEDLNRYPNTKTINVYINSPGGSVFAAAAIINQLRAHAATVHTWCDGICASAAVGILLAADPGCRHMSRATLLMIHNPSTEARGDQKTFLKTADLLAKVKQTLLNIYVEGTGMDAQQLSQMMDDETYLDADEAKTYNFIDDITEDDASYDFRNDGGFSCNGISMDIAASVDMSRFRQKLQQLQNQRNPQTSKEGGSNNMTFEEFLASLDESARGLVQAAIANQIQAREAELAVQNAAALSELRASNATLQEQVNQLTADLEAARQPAQSTQDAILDSVPEEVRAMLAQARADAVAAQQQLRELQDAAEFQAFRETFAEFGNLPLTDAHMRAMQALSRNSAEMYNDLRELLKVANNAMGAGFQAVGSDGGEDGSAFERLENAVKAFQQEHPEASYNEAMKAVLRKNPGLYDSYRDEMGI